MGIQQKFLKLFPIVEASELIIFDSIDKIVLNGFYLIKANDFLCVLCDYKSSWANGLEVHMGRKHRNIDQLDGSNDIEELELDKKYDRSEHYWEKGNVGIAYSIFLDANCLVDASNLSEKEKSKEKAKLLDSRKSVFGNNFHQFPPWCKK